MTRAEAIARARAVYDCAEHNCTDPDCEMTRRLVEALDENVLLASTFRAERDRLIADLDAARGQGRREGLAEAVRKLRARAEWAWRDGPDDPRRVLLRAVHALEAMAKGGAK